MEQYHPINNLIYFCFVIGCSMIFLHPVCLLISIICAASYTVILFGFRRAGKGFAGVLVLMLLTALINPTFSHQGVTELMMLPSGNMLTLESVYFGIGAAFMLGATLLWFRAVSEILTADKIVYLFGRTFPVLGLLLSMILGFVPKIRRKYSEIKLCRKNEPGAAWRNYIKNLSILVTWILEDSVEMGKSMRGRGYGLPGRTWYTIFRFTKRDAVMLLFMILAGGYVIIGSVRGALSWYYYPITMGAEVTFYSVSVYIVYALICIQPTVCELSRQLLITPPPIGEDV